MPASQGGKDAKMDGEREETPVGDKPPSFGINEIRNNLAGKKQLFGKSKSLVYD